MGALNTSQSIEEIAAGFLGERELENFLNFYDFLRSNKIGKGKTGKTGISSWAIKCKGKKIGHFKFHSNSWSLDFFDLFARNNWLEKCEKHMTAELENFILANIHTTSNCCAKGVCHSVENKIILGKMFSGRVCACAPIVLYDPDGKTLEYAKELVLIGKNVIAEWRKAV